VAKKYTADELIDLVRRRAAVPDVESAGSAGADILAYLNEELYSKIMPHLMRAREDYFVQAERVPLVSNQSAYRLPKRAAGQKLRSLVYTSSDGARSTVDFISRREAELFSADTSDIPMAFFIEGNHVVLRPDLSSANGAFLEMSYFFRPGELALIANGRRITAVNLGTKTVTVASLVSGWIAGSLLDIHSENSGSEIHAWDLTVASTTATTVTFNEAINGSVYGTRPVEVGDYLVSQEQAVIPALPRELHVALAQAAVCRLAEAGGDIESLRAHGSELTRELRDAMELITPRVDSKPKKIKGLFNPLYGSTFNRSRRVIF